jgi:hypothetical protein
VVSEFDDVAGFEVFAVHGNPTREEEEALLDALGEFLSRDEREGEARVLAKSPAWKLAGRLAARRGGILDARSSFGRRTWPLSARVPWAGRAHAGRVGRGDSR